MYFLIIFCIVFAESFPVFVSLLLALLLLPTLMLQAFDAITTILLCSRDAPRHLSLCVLLSVASSGFSSMWNTLNMDNSWAFSHLMLKILYSCCPNIYPYLCLDGTHTFMLSGTFTALQNSFIAVFSWQYHACICFLRTGALFLIFPLVITPFAFTCDKYTLYSYGLKSRQLSSYPSIHLQN